LQQLTIIHPSSYTEFVRGSVSSIFVIEGGEEQLASFSQLYQSMVPDMSYLFTSQTGGTTVPASGRKGK